MALFILLVAGCDSFGLGQIGIDGYWKGQMVKLTVDDRTPEPIARNGERPRRILMSLQEEEGSVHGKFAQSSDAVAFKQLDKGGARSVSVHTVTGALDGPRIRIRFSGDTGGNFEVDATVSEDRISGTYSAKYGPDSPNAYMTQHGKFEVERY